jgi:hypothetical protein
MLSGLQISILRLNKHHRRDGKSSSCVLATTKALSYSEEWSLISWPSWFWKHFGHGATETFRESLGIILFPETGLLVSLHSALLSSGPA